MIQFMNQRRVEDDAFALYREIAAHARRPEFFDGGGLPDTVDGRFDLLVLHVFLVMHRLKQEKGRTAPFSQALFDVLFQDLDESLRRLGAGDMGVGRRTKAMAEGFYGRVMAYERALDGAGEDLEDCVRRNLFAAGEASPAQVRRLADYVRGVVADLAAQDIDDLLAGRVRFAEVPGAGGDVEADESFSAR